MADDENDNDGPAAPERVVEDPADVPTPERDYLLGQFISVANLGASFGVTLTVGGLIITGTLIGGKEYLELLASSVDAAGFGKKEGEEETALGKLVRSYSHLYDDVKFDTFATPGYIHLKNVQFIPVSGTGNTFNGVLWRGRLMEVSGWTLGVASI